MGEIRSSYKQWDEATSLLEDVALLGEIADAAPGTEIGRWFKLSTLLNWLRAQAITFTQTVTFSKEVSVSVTGATGGFVASVDNGQLVDFRLQTGGANRWAVRKTNASETGTNAGSPLQIKCYDDDGVLLRNALQIDRADGLWTIVGDVKLSAGRLYGTALHNPASGMAGTTSQYVGSGTYTPTLTSVTNIAAATAYECQYMRVGNVVTVSGQVDIDPTANSVATELGISLPITSDLAAIRQCAGTACAGSFASLSARIAGDLTNNRASLTFVAPADNANRGWSFHFTYLVL